jgi:hypothetical protein
MSIYLVPTSVDASILTYIHWLVRYMNPNVTQTYIHTYTVTVTVINCCLKLCPAVPNQCPGNREPSRDESEHDGKERYHQDRDRDRDHGEEDRKERAELLAMDIADDEHIPSMYACIYKCGLYDIIPFVNILPLPLSGQVR